MKGIFSFLIGFLLLFFIYHFPEFFSAFWIMAVFKIGFLFIALVIARFQGWKGLEGYGLGISRRGVYHLGAGLLTGSLFFALSFFLSVGLGYEKLRLVISFNQVMESLPMILLMTAFPSIAEDILTRGYLYAHLKFMRPVAWVLLSAFIYVLNHIWRLNDGAAVLTYLFLLGIVLALAVLISRSLWLAFGIHWGANIAFESGNSFFHTESLVQQDENTWVLAFCWALLLAMLIILFRNRIGRSMR